MICNQINRSIAYGNIAFWLGKKADQTQSYRWICFVRGINNEDISYFVKEVVFTLHPSFTNHIRVISTFPFEIQEHGWGEFEINIKIYFAEEYQKPVELFHLLKLHPSVPNIVTNQKKPLVSEFYDEVVFLNPSAEFIEKMENFDKIQNELKMKEEQLKQAQALSEQQQQQQNQETQQQLQTQIEQEELKDSDLMQADAIDKQDDLLPEEQLLKSQQKEEQLSQQQLQQGNESLNKYYQKFLFFFKVTNQLLLKIIIKQFLHFKIDFILLVIFIRLFIINTNTLIITGGCFILCQF